VKFAFIDAEKATWPVAWMCRKLGVSRSGFYAFQGRRESPRAVEDGRLRTLVAAAHRAGRRTYGSPRIQRELRDVHGIRIGRNRVIRLTAATASRSRQTA
jgi:putative transposase